MADRPVPVLEFLDEGCPDCGRRVVDLPRDPVVVPDDFDWTARDFEGFRRIMLEDLAAADPERQRWTEADMEVAIVETLAAGLDRASHALDTVFAERFVQTARMPVSLVWLLDMIDGTDPAFEAVFAELTDEERVAYGFDGSTSKNDALRAALSARPQLMGTAKAGGLSELGKVVSLMRLEDLARFLDDCPLVAQAATRMRNEGGRSVYEAVLALNETNLRLHDLVSEIALGRTAFEEWVLAEKDAAIPPDQTLHPSNLLTSTVIQDFSIRSAMSRIVAPLLPLGTDLRLVDGIRVGIFLRLCVQVEQTYYRSEVEILVRRVLSIAPKGVFDPERLDFGGSIFLSDVEEALMAIPGVAGVLINRFQIAGRPASDATATGILRPGPAEVLTLDPTDPSSETGYVVLEMQGGRVG